MDLVDGKNLVECHLPGTFIEIMDIYGRWDSIHIPLMVDGKHM